MKTTAMRLKCPICGEMCETDEMPIVGQHLLCPFCNKKFSYGIAYSKSNTKSSPKVIKYIIFIVLVLLAVFMYAAKFGNSLLNLEKNQVHSNVETQETINQVHSNVETQETIAMERYKRALEWYNAQLEYNGIYEQSFVNDEDHKWLTLCDRECNPLAIELTPSCGLFTYPNNMPVGFAKQLLSTRVLISDYERSHGFKETQAKRGFSSFPGLQAQGLE